MTGGYLDLATLAALLGVVAFGAVVPVLPTGATVSAAAALASQEHWWEALVVIGVGALGAYLGDLVTYAVLRAAGRPLAARLHWLRDEDDLDRVRARIEEREVQTLLVSRLVPGGRIPVLLVAAFAGYPWVRYASAAGLAALLWSATYAVVGITGGLLLPDVTTAVVVAALGGLVLTLGLRWVRREPRPG